MFYLQQTDVEPLQTLITSRGSRPVFGSGCQTRAVASSNVFPSSPFSYRVEYGQRSEDSLYYLPKTSDLAVRYSLQAVGLLIHLWKVSIEEKTQFYKPSCHCCPLLTSS